MRRKKEREQVREREQVSELTGFVAMHFRYEDRTRDRPYREPTPIPDHPPFVAYVGNLSFDVTENELGEFFATGGCEVCACVCACVHGAVVMLVLVILTLARACVCVCVCVHTVDLNVSGVQCSALDGP